MFLYCINKSNRCTVHSMSVLQSRVSIVPCDPHCNMLSTLSNASKCEAFHSTRCFCVGYYFLAGVEAAAVERGTGAKSFSSAGQAHNHSTALLPLSSLVILIAVRPVCYNTGPGCYNCKTLKIDSAASPFQYTALWIY